MNKKNFLGSLLISFAAFAQAEENTGAVNHIDMHSYWLLEQDGSTMLDPQTSGLARWRDGKLLTIADGSADKSQIMRIIQLDPNSKRILAPKIPIKLADSVKNSCFAEYLGKNPDLEALVVDPSDDNILYSVTEDASKYQLSPDCAKRYGQTGSTLYPTLLTKIEIQGDVALMSAVRPIQYSASMQVGNHPNDGIEGMTFANGKTLYLALEKDDAGAARIFTADIDEGFWQTQAFYPVKDAKLKLPGFEKGNHPINGLTYFADGQGTGWLVAAARNDNQLWLLDVAGVRAPKVVQLGFLAEVLAPRQGCGEYEPMLNYSIEGLAYAQDKVWLVNDPWKINYRKNIKCASNKLAYESMSPLLTSIAVVDLLK